jgi:mannobiose 2-epimerase
MILKNELFAQLKDEMSHELQSILDYWTRNTIDKENGGFYGRINGQNQIIPNSDKGAVLNARILYTYSAAYRILKNPKLIDIAHRAKIYLLEKFWDQEHGGIYWMLDYKGNAADTKKQIYALSFAMYALTEYFRVTNDKEALDYAIQLFELIEKYSFDKDLNGYFEAYSREWELLEDLRLSEKDENERKTMNTHLHILEAYTNLYRVWPNKKLQKQLRNLIEIFTEKIIDKTTNSFNLFFDESWFSKSEISSFGHDIEGTWLLYEAAEVLNDKALIVNIEDVILKMIDQVAKNGLDADGGMVYEGKQRKVIDFDKHWWPQAEAIVGFVNAWQLSKNEDYLEKAINVWTFTKNKIIDKQNGEWFFRVNREGTPYIEEDKVGPWKCPYHNSRACLEIIERYEKLNN